MESPSLILVPSDSASQRKEIISLMKVSLNLRENKTWKEISKSRDQMQFSS